MKSCIFRDYPYKNCIVNQGRLNLLTVDGDKAILSVRKESTVEQRERFVNEWYRSKLKDEIHILLPKWEKITGLYSDSWQTKNMTTRWGTCMRRQIDGLASIVEQKFSLSPMSDMMFVFHNRHCDKIKILYWDGDGFCLLYKRMEKGKFHFLILSISLDKIKWCVKKQGITLPKSLTGRAIIYALSQKKSLCTYLKNPLLELTNNAAERAVRPVVMGRKNWLFANTEAGAKAVATIFSIIETANANLIKPQKYLNWLFDRIRAVDFNSFEDLLPWSEAIPNNLRLENA